MSLIYKPLAQDFKLASQALLLGSLLAACSYSESGPVDIPASAAGQAVTNQGSTPRAASTGPRQPETSFHGSIVSAAPTLAAGPVNATAANGCDYRGSNGAGTRLNMTLLLPERGADEPLPLILNGHGWGSRRLAAPDDGLLTLIMREGYAVLSFDFRGWNAGITPTGSDGQTRFIDPCYEGVDVSAMIDWALTARTPDGHAVQIAVDGRGDPLVGMLGSSYGGGIQMLASAMDPRIDALVPLFGWADSASIFVPGGVIHKANSQRLCQARNTVSFDPSYRAFCNALNNSNNRNASQLAASWNPAPAFLQQRNVAAPGLPAPQADVLAFQGMADTLVPASEGVLIQNAFRAAGRDAHLFINNYAHAQPIRGGDSRADAVCAGLNPIDVMIDWFAVKLHGAPESRLSYLPDICLALTPTRGLRLTAMPTPASHYANIALRVDAALTQRDNSYGANIFVPVSGQVRQTGYLAGQVQLNNLQLDVAGGNASPVAILGLGLRRNGIVRLLESQVTGIAGPQHDGRTTLQLVAAEVQPGDVIGLIAYREHIRHTQANSTARDNLYQLRADLILPLFADDGRPMTP